MGTRIGWLLAMCIAGGTAQAATCALNAQNLSHAQALAKARGAAAIAHVQKAVAGCPSYDSYETLGVILGHSRNRRDWLGAADAFVDAEALASEPKARAETLFQYASLVNDDNDPQNAYPMIEKAHALDPGRKDIATLAHDIEKQVRTPQKVQLERSFGLSVYKPFHSSGSDAISGSDFRQVNIPINFEFNSVELSPTTRDNINTLAQILASTKAQGDKHFLFVGHSDSRGDELYNTELSRRRADAMRNAVVQIEPALAGRIDTEGRGSSEPVDSGTGLAAMQANRRLQVLQK
jgi:outer membrane protein OmpA-like peptidoglycan-associated protein